MSIDMAVIKTVQNRAGWRTLEGVIDVLEEPGTISAGQRSLTDQQIAVIDGQRQINGGLLDAIRQILNILDSLEAQKASGAPTEQALKIAAVQSAVEGLLGKVPPGCQAGG